MNQFNATTNAHIRNLASTYVAASAACGVTVTVTDAAEIITAQIAEVAAILGTPTAEVVMTFTEDLATALAAVNADGYELLDAPVAPCTCGAHDLEDTVELPLVWSHQMIVTLAGVTRFAARDEIEAKEGAAVASAAIALLAAELTAADAEGRDAVDVPISTLELIATALEFLADDPYDDWCLCETGVDFGLVDFDLCDQAVNIIARSSEALDHVNDLLDAYATA